MSKSTTGRAGAYREPALMAVPVAAATFGNGEIDTDTLGNTKTQYGKWIGDNPPPPDDPQPS